MRKRSVCIEIQSFSFHAWDTKVALCFEFMPEWLSSQITRVFQGLLSIYNDIRCDNGFVLLISVCLCNFLYYTFVVLILNIQITKTNTPSCRKNKWKWLFLSSVELNDIVKFKQLINSVYHYILSPFYVNITQNPGRVAGDASFPIFFPAKTATKWESQVSGWADFTLQIPSCQFRAACDPGLSHGSAALPYKHWNTQESY